MDKTTASAVIGSILRRATNMNLGQKDLGLYLAVCSEPGKTAKRYKEKAALKDWAYGRSLGKLVHMGAIRVEVDKNNRRQYLLFPTKPPSEMFGQPFKMLESAHISIGNDIDSTQASIISFLEENGEASTSDLSDDIGLRSGAILKAANGLVEQGVLIVSKKGNDEEKRVNHYKLKK